MKNLRHTSIEGNVKNTPSKVQAKYLKIDCDSDVKKNKTLLYREKYDLSEYVKHIIVNGCALSRDTLSILKREGGGIKSFTLF